METLYSDLITDSAISEIEKSLLEGISRHHFLLKFLLSAHTHAHDDQLPAGSFIFAPNEELNNIVARWAEDKLNSPDSGRDTLEGFLFGSLVELRKAVVQLLSGNYSEFVKLFGISCQLLSQHHSWKTAADDLLPKYDSLVKKDLARKGGEAKDIKQGYSEKRAKIREIWASGKYSSRDVCAEQESAALGMSFSTARKALRGFPASIDTPSSGGRGKR